MHEDHVSKSFVRFRIVEDAHERGYTCSSAQQIEALAGFSSRKTSVPMDLRNSDPRLRNMAHRQVCDGLNREILH